MKSLSHPIFFRLFFVLQLKVSTTHNRDYQYDLSVAEYIEVSDKRAEQYEIQTQRKKEKSAMGDTHDVRRFLKEALSTNSVSTDSWSVLLSHLIL